MLVARRDPPFHVDARDGSPGQLGPYPVPKAPRMTRFITAVQMFGSLLAVPVGIASAYSFYRANFSPDTTCQNLRASIVAMLDKSVDATTRRVLVRRDVETFEKTCGTVDPEATAAFKTLLSVDKVVVAPAAPAPAAVSKTQHVEPAPAKEPPRKVDARPQPASRQASPAQPPAIETARREPGVSDAQWLDAVRNALVVHKPEPRPVENPQPKAVPAPVASAPPAQRAPDPAPAIVSRTPSETSPVTPPASPPAVSSVSAPPPAVPSVAPPLPPAISVAPPPQQASTDHPVPPEAIPDTPSPADTEVAKADEHRSSRIGKWISEIPLLGSIVNNGRQ